MANIKRVLNKWEAKAHELKGEAKGRLKQIQQDAEQRSANEE